MPVADLSCSYCGEIFELKSKCGNIGNKIADGAYSGKENHDLATEKNIRLINTDLFGKPVDDILADFVFNEDGTKVVSHSSFMFHLQETNVLDVRTKIDAKPKFTRESVL